MSDQPELEPWMLPGVFVICTDDHWKRATTTGHEAPPTPPRKGKVYTLAGVIRFPGGLVFALAEFPHYGFPAANFTHTPHHEHALFRRMLNPNAPIDAHEITIKGRTH